MNVQHWTSNFQRRMKTNHLKSTDFFCLFCCFFSFIIRCWTFDVRCSFVLTSNARPEPNRRVHLFCNQSACVLQKIINKDYFFTHRFCWRPRNSLSDLLPAPSLILLVIDIADLHICEVNPYSSSFGNDAVNLYSFYQRYRLLPNIHFLVIHTFMSNSLYY